MPLLFGAQITAGRNHVSGNDSSSLLLSVGLRPQGMGDGTAGASTILERGRPSGTAATYTVVATRTASVLGKERPVPKATQTTCVEATRNYLEGETGL